MVGSVRPGGLGWLLANHIFGLLALGVIRNHIVYGLAITQV